MAKQRNVLGRPGVFTFVPEMAGIQAKARRLDGTISGFANKTRVIHRDTVREMAKVAGQRIDDSEGATVRPRNMRTGRLRAAVENPASHRWTDEGFVFLDHESMYSQVVYWRLIEEGTHMFVGRLRRFIFLSGNTGRRVQPNPRRRGQDTVLVGTELLSSAMGPTPTGRPRRGAQRQYEGLPQIRIKTPIQPHHYAQYAIAQFERGDYAEYKAKIVKAANESGLALVIH